MNIPRLSAGGVRHEHFERIANNTDNKNNPIALDKEELLQILEISL
jgi:hypothetical protein